jgi:hypothetical protein
MNFENVEHFAILLGVVATIFGLLKGLQGWRGARDEAIAARTRQEDMIAGVAEQLKPRNGRTLATTVETMDDALKAHCAAAATSFADNAKDHEALNAKVDAQALRVDGLFELLGTSNTPRKTAERHRVVRETEEEED